jgi:hypothetical protein
VARGMSGGRAKGSVGMGVGSCAGWGRLLRDGGIGGPGASGKVADDGLSPAALALRGR